LARSGSSPRPARRAEQQGAGWLGLHQRAQKAAEDRAAVDHRGGDRGGLVVVAVARADPDLEIVGDPEGDVGEDVERLGLGAVGRGLDMAGLQIRGDAGGDRPGQRIAELRGRALQQQGGEGGVAKQGGRGRIGRGAAGDQAAAMKRAGEPGEQHALVELGRGALISVLAEIGEADEGGDRAVVVPGEA
jgi:hypothetical protein